MDWKHECIEVNIKCSGKYDMLSRIPAKEQSNAIDVYRRKPRIQSHHRSYDVQQNEHRKEKLILILGKIFWTALSLSNNIPNEVVEDS